MSRRSSRRKSFSNFALSNGQQRSKAAGFSRRMWFEVLEERVLLASDLSTGLQNTIKTGAAAAGTLVDALHDRIFDRVIQRSQPLIGNALQVKDTANDKLNVLSN